MDYLIIHNFLTRAKCQELIDISEAKGYEEADISFPEGGKMIKSYRDNYRCLYRDEKLRQELEYLLFNVAPKEFDFIKEGGIIEKLPFLKLSGNFRFYKYLPGQKFKKHRDANQLEEGGLSLITVLFYLNDVEEGGETGVYDPDTGEKILVKAETGKILRFNHTVAHTGEEIVKGVKYVLRTDFIYKV
jgi:prolyl 4-hydroxylase